MGMLTGNDVTISSPNQSGEPVDPWGITFGPVPSRRFGRSLGINNIPPKVCTYSCAYCQIGRTTEMRCRPGSYFGAEAVTRAVRRRVEEARRAGEPIDQVAFVPDGEPTLDLDLGRTVALLGTLGVPVTVITNGSLVFLPEVQAALAQADRVSLKVDTVREATWRKVNRPHRRLELSAILDGMRTFASGYRGLLTTETMLLEGVNDGLDDLMATAAFVGELKPATTYLAVPIRPPAETWARPPKDSTLVRAYEVFRAFHPCVELLLGYEGDEFASTGDAVEDLLSITAVHPMREAAARRLLGRRNQPWAVVRDLLDRGELVAVQYGLHRYYVRPLGRPPSAAPSLGDTHDLPPPWDR